MKCKIISIGNELLIGDTVNTNASWMGRFLTDHGVEVTEIITISDDLEQIKKTILHGLEQADLVISTGGLGPTHDDITREAVCKIFDARLVVHKPTLVFIKGMFEKRNIPFSRSNYHQAEVPENCEVLVNNQGTAPGMWFEELGSQLAVLPGVPFEMKHLMEEQVLPKIEATTQGKEQFFSRYLVTAGIGESTLSDDIIGELSHYLTDDLSVAYLPGLQGIKIRISGYGNNREAVLDQIEPVITYICKRAGSVIIGEGRDYTLSEALGECLRKYNLTISTAESCTGGLLSDSITDIPGSSDYMVGGIVAYANTAKIKLLDVNEKTIHQYGAVSKEVALQMARGVSQKMKSDIGISTTGIAGPGGGTPEKPVGTIWIGFWSKDWHFALKTLFTNHRLINKERSVAVALEMVRRTVLGIEPMPYGLKQQIL